VGFLLLAGPPLAGAGEAGIAWRSGGLAKALEEAKASKRPVFVAINAEKVDGGRVEPASRMLREEIYLHPSVVERSKAFVCVLLTDPISDADGAELRSRFGIDGMIVSPQHVLAHADGTLIQRKEYWEFAADASVEALGSMMTRAAKAHEVRLALPPLGPEPASRSAWIAGAVAILRAGPDVELRKAAARELVAADQDGDCLAPMNALLVEVKEPKKEDVTAWVEIARLLGRPGAEAGVPGLCAVLESKDAALRSNAAVSLEYVGSAKAVDALAKRVAKEKEESVRGNLCRALGRCGAKDANARKALLREAQAARSDRLALGPVLGLAYFEGDADAARGLEKALKKGEGGLKRAAIVWALVEIGDPGSAAFLRSQLTTGDASPTGSRFLGSALACFEGQRETRKAEVDQGFRYASYEAGLRSDSARTGRTDAKFTPKGDA
jgi:hypothetical protein